MTVDSTPGIELPTRDGYDRWASSYDSDANPLPALEEPWVHRLVGDVRGLTVLDLGCGTGRHALWLASNGATVHALDFSPAMLDEARRKAEEKDVVFQVHDLTTPLPFPAASFDGIVCGLVVDHIADLRSFFCEMRRVCRPIVWAVVSVVHPAMMLRGVRARFRDAESGLEVRPASYSHQLTDYILAAARARFAFDHLSEQVVDEELASRVERAKRYVGWPLLFLMRLSPSREPVSS
jgi:ubiquinone/menaquinone biosynthesis C-methylase UbiE